MTILKRHALIDTVNICQTLHETSKKNVLSRHISKRPVFVHVTLSLTGALLPHALGQLEPELAENTEKHTVTADTVITVHEVE